MITAEDNPLEGLPKNLKIGFCVDGMSGPPSGAWTRFRSLVVALSSLGIEIHVLGVEGVHNEATDLPLKSCQLRPKSSLLERIRRRKRVDQFARETGAHLIHLEAPPFVGGTVAPTIASIHDLRHFRSSSRTFFTGEALYQLFLLRFHARRVAFVLSLTSFVAREIHRTLGVPLSQVGVVPPVVEKPMIAKPYERNSRNRYAVALGHLERRKNLGVIVAASGEDSWPKGVDLLIVGGDHGDLEDLASMNCSVSGKAIFVGAVSDEEKWKLLQGALVVLLPSFVEGFGIVAVEAPLSGAPVLVSDNPSFSEVGGHPFAFVDPDNPGDWAKAVNFLSNNPKLRSEILLRQQEIAKNFTGQQVAISLLNCYRTVVGCI